MPDLAHNNLKILVVGCGKMGSALVQRWIELFPNIFLSVIEPSGLPPGIKGVQHYSNTDAMPVFNGDMVVLAVKPQIMADVCTALLPKLGSSVPVLSIAAGKDLAFYEGILGANRPVIRTIPNTPAAIGEGLTFMVCNAGVDGSQKSLGEALMKSVGDIFWLPEEDMMHAFTAIASSGVAYVFHLMEVLGQCAQNAGMNAEQAAYIGRQTVIGASLLAHADKNTPASTLRENVTSPQGTTYAALQILMDKDKGLQQLMNDAVDAAIQRGKELAQ